MADDEGLSIEETNKLRLSLGLKPLKVKDGDQKDGSPAITGTIDQDQVASDNFRQRRAQEDKDRKAREAAERLRKVKERVEREKQIKGKTLADESEDEDTLDWIRRTKTAVKKEPEMVRQHDVPQPALEYTAQNLDGLRVGHDVGDFENGGETVLTLRDSGVLDDDAQDELVNVEINEQQALKDKLQRKKRKSVYTSYDDEDEEQDVNDGTQSRKILARYDEDVDAGPKRKAGFAINSVAEQKTQTIPAGHGETMVNGRVRISLDDLSTTQPTSSDYAEPVKMRKPKKKKPLRKARSEALPGAESMASETPTNSATDDPVLDNFVDDDDLQASLAKQRRLAAQARAQKRKLMDPDQIALLRPVAEEAELHEGHGGLVLDETTEFTRGLQDIKLLEPKIKREPSTDANSTPAEVGDEEMTDVAQVKEEVTEAEISTTGIEDEATFDQGVGAAMAMLRQKGVLKQSDPQDSSAKQTQEAWLAKNKKILVNLEMERRRVREELRNSPKYRNMSVREREALAASENRRLDAIEARAAQERFKDYKPNVEIKYVDDFGRNMTQKEAFKHLSHQFHGKDSGSGKTAKKLAQIEKEKALEQRSLFK
ncbi:putative DNA binding protein SART-1 [Taphrina deformans PYCC 5710]|uniref:DNA binding protein SART-1 n=1 Tax=Taphrina deformans (strain PYCC 5710 / ATCC 11124 / CBS 356.35 / IMI 108563 / JCM 9778 / NBRC 8474) TaxID=1097556 RepID=R4XAI7_TAPDE|nr:putative DNA binding protein SART-1 [Taphrina deformans PYCC 5710]|eukprot:CCG81302.1 putative DNA binding protein SART-1 [Taphrina deformans PYCC 5710]